MNKKSMTVVAVVTLALLTFTFSALTAFKVFAAPPDQTANETQAQPAPGTKKTSAAKWEYRMMISPHASNLEQGANKLSDEGFELFKFEIVPSFVDSSGTTNTQQFVMVLRRAKP